MPTPPLANAHTPYPKSLRLDPNRLKVFVCDDDLDFACEMASALSESGFEARTLKDGRTPVEIFEMFAPDVVLLDIHMPPPDGFAIINHIVQNKYAHAVSVVLLSGADVTTLDIASRFSSDRGLKLAAVLQKPVRLADVLAVCSAHRRQSRMTA